MNIENKDLKRELELEEEDLRMRWSVLKILIDGLEENGHPKLASIFRKVLNRAIDQICDKFDDDVEFRNSWKF